MLSKYKKIFLFLLPQVFLSAALQAQNTPQESQTSVSGTSSGINYAPYDLTNVTAQPNFIRVYSPKVPMVSEPYLNTVVPAEVQVATDYKDGFNRTMMSVAHSATTNGSALMNVIQPFDTRFTRYQFGLLPYASSSADFNPAMFTKENEYYYALYPNEDHNAMSKTQLLSTASARGSTTFLPGKSQIGQNRSITTAKVANPSNQVRIWGLDGSGLPVSSSYYAEGQLFGEKTTDATGAESVVYTDRDGKVIWKRILQSTIPSGQTVTPVYAYTFYVYDDYNRLRYTFPPLAYDASLAGSISSTDLNQLCFQYQYDNRGRLSGQRKPGEDGFTLFVYDKKDRLVMRQTPNETAAGQWEVTFYDIQGRVKASSLYTNSSNQAYWQTMMDSGTPGGTAASLSWHLMTDAGAAAYPAENDISGNTMMSYSYYDDYSRADANGGKWNTFGSQLMFTEALTTDNAEPVERSDRTLGMVTGGKVRILPAPGISTAQTGQWTESAVFYDDKGRSIYSVAWDIDGSNFVHEHYTGVQYNFMGQVLISKHRMKNPAAGSSDDHIELSRNFYNAQTGQLTKTMHKNDDQIWTVSSLYTYDELGKAKRKVLGNYGEVQDMTYTLRGQLKGINETYALTGNKQGESRSFGEALRYDYGFDQPRYDGKVAGMIWRGANTSTMYAYGYGYDYGGRLKSADFRYNNTGYSWVICNMDYSVSDLNYDLNGNITSMNQKGPGNGAPTFIDKLAYTYSGNRLTKVVDAITTDYGNGDLQNPNGTNSDYTYDANGNITADNNKGIASVTYNHFNKPVVVTLGSGKSISYSYNAAGVKLQEKVVDPVAGNKTTNYVGNYIYDGSQLSYVLTGDGRSVYNKDNGLFTEEYFVKDHLGNVRSTVDVKTYPVMQYLASYELASANLENLFFDNIDQVRDDRPGATFNGDVKAARLNAGEPDHQTGTSLLLKVMAGDKVEMNVNNFYENYDANDDGPLGWEEMMNSVLSTLTNGEGGVVEGEFHDVSKLDEKFSSTNMETFENLVQAATDPSKPKAYLNYILFDENMRIVESSSGSFQANGNGTWTQIGTVTPLEIPQNGYLAVYLENRSKMSCHDCANVFFDQLVVRFSKGVLKEESHYYPFGLPIKNMGSVASGFTANRRKYQSNEYITEAGLNWMDFHNRSYDPQIGRFLQVDPLAEYTDVMSPYVAMNNDPIFTVDPLGLQGFNSMDREGAKDKFVNPLMEFLSRFSPGTLKAWGFGGANNKWNFGAGLMIKEAMSQEKTRTLDDMLKEANANPGSIVTNFGVGPMNIMPFGYDIYGNKLYYYAESGSIGVYGNDKHGDPNVTDQEKGADLTFWSDALGSVGTLGGAVEVSTGGLRIAKNFSALYGASRIDYRPLTMGIRNFRASTFSLSFVGKVAGTGTFVLGTAIDGFGVYNYYQYGPKGIDSKGEEHFVQHPGKAGLNLGVGFWGLAVGGVAGFTGGLFYFGIDVFYPGGWPAASARSAELETRERAMTGHSFFSNSAYKQ